MTNKFLLAGVSALALAFSANAALALNDTITASDDAATNTVESNTNGSGTQVGDVEVTDSLNAGSGNDVGSNNTNVLNSDDTSTNSGNSGQIGETNNNASGNTLDVSGNGNDNTLNSGNSNTQLVLGVSATDSSTNNGNSGLIAGEDNNVGSDNAVGSNNTVGSGNGLGNNNQLGSNNHADDNLSGNTVNTNGSGNNISLSNTLTGSVSDASTNEDNSGQIAGGTANNLSGNTLTVTGNGSNNDIDNSNQGNTDTTFGLTVADESLNEDNSGIIAGGSNNTASNNETHVDDNFSGNTVETLATTATLNVIDTSTVWGNEASFEDTDSVTVNVLSSTVAENEINFNPAEGTVVEGNIVQGSLDGFSGAASLVQNNGLQSNVQAALTVHVGEVNF